MTSLWKDILAALMMGMVLPGVVLNLTVSALRQETADIEVTAVQEVQAPERSAPVLVRREEDRTEQWAMEPYLVGVVLAEMPASFSEEALKAQSVAARTFARKAWETGGKHEDGSVCINSGCCQAYIEPETYLERGGTPDNLEKVRSAVWATAGECLQYAGELIEATYFSCSGGSTEPALAVWGTEYPYLQAVESPGEEGARWYTDRVVFSEELLEFLLEIPLEGEPESWFGQRTYTPGGGVETLEIGGKTFTGTKLRSLLGLRSTAFTVDCSGENIVITTRGYGHRVGMSQYGAEAMAVRGNDYQKILYHYYPGTKLTVYTRN
jgi:stage II sporulation protein D